MNQTEYEQKKMDAWRGEVTGELFFRKLAELCIDSEASEKWLTLASLEAFVGEALHPLLHADGVVSSEERAAAEEMAENFARLADDEVMRSILTVVNNVVPEYKTLWEAAPPNEQSVLQLLYDHEVAIRTFAERELADDGADSLQDVLRITQP